MLRSLPTWCVMFTLCTLAVPGQDRIPLPPGPASLQALPGWSTAGSPTPPEPAGPLLARKQQTLRDLPRPDEHVLVHAAGSKPGELRLVHCFSSADPVGSEDLRDLAFVDRLRAEVARNLAAPGATVEYIGSRQPTWFASGSLAVEFTVVHGGQSLRVEHHLVPAGTRTQNFEATWFESDVDARGEIEALLRTFDGAAAGRADRTLQTMLLGGLCGGILGVVTARLRQRRRAAANAATAGN